MHAALLQHGVKPGYLCLQLADRSVPLRDGLLVVRKLGVTGRHLALESLNLGLARRQLPLQRVELIVEVGTSLGQLVRRFLLLLLARLLHSLV